MMETEDESDAPRGASPSNQQPLSNQSVWLAEIDRLFTDQFTTEEIQQLESGAVEFNQLAEGLVIDRWFALVPALQLLRERALRAANAKQPKGWYYNAIWNGFIGRFYPSL